MSSGVRSTTERQHVPSHGHRVREVLGVCGGCDGPDGRVVLLQVTDQDE